jgi:hypothetical protein
MAICSESPTGLPPFLPFSELDAPLYKVQRRLCICLLLFLALLWAETSESDRCSSVSSSFAENSVFLRFGWSRPHHNVPPFIFCYPGVFAIFRTMVYLKILPNVLPLPDVAAPLYSSPYSIIAFLVHPYSHFGDLYFKGSSCKTSLAWRISVMSLDDWMIGLKTIYWLCFNPT